MLFYLFPVLWGILLTTFLCAPLSYYPILLIILSISIAIFIYSLIIFKKPSKRFYLIALLPLLISYGVTSFIIFRPPTSSLSCNKSLSPNKHAIIFYCNGEMEKYSPSYAGKLITATNYFYKPIASYRLKNIYRNSSYEKGNSTVLKIASEVRTSLLNYKPYYFYIALSNYFPDLNNALQSAINDGCQDIKIINYTNVAINNEVLHDKKLKEIGLNISVTKEISTSKYFVSSIIDRIINLPQTFQGILLIGLTTPSTNALKENLIVKGYKEENIITSQNISESLKYFKAKGVSNLLYVNLLDSGNGYNSQITIPQTFEKYTSTFIIRGFNNWGYDKLLIRAVIDSIEPDNKTIVP